MTPLKFLENPSIGVFLSFFFLISLLGQKKNFARKKNGLFLKPRPQKKMF